jgi:endonuclease YncB( thermonuclease family)
VWRRIVEDLEPGWELDSRELLILEAAARQADQNRALEAALAADGVTVEGSKGQPRLNATTTELRQGRIALEKLLSGLALPGDEGALTSAQRRAQAAADSRWRRRGVRRGAA